MTKKFPEMVCGEKDEKSMFGWKSCQFMLLNGDILNVVKIIQPIWIPCKNYKNWRKYKEENKMREENNKIDENNKVEETTNSRQWQWYYEFSKWKCGT